MQNSILKVEFCVFKILNRLKLVFYIFKINKL